MAHVKNIGPLVSRNAVCNSLIASHKTPHFVPRAGVCSPKIKAADVVLFDRGDDRQLVVPFAVMAEHDPSLRTYFCHPLVVWRVLVKSKFVILVVVVLDSERRIPHTHGERKAFAEASVKIKCQFSRDLPFPPFGNTPSNLRASLMRSLVSPKSVAMSVSLSPAFHRPLMTQVGVPFTMGAPNE